MLKRKLTSQQAEYQKLEWKARLTERNTLAAENQVRQAKDQIKSLGQELKRANDILAHARAKTEVDLASSSPRSKSRGEAKSGNRGEGNRAAAEPGLPPRAPGPPSIKVTMEVRDAVHSAVTSGGEGEEAGEAWSWERQELAQLYTEQCEEVARFERRIAHLEEEMLLQRESFEAQVEDSRRDAMAWAMAFEESAARQEMLMEEKKERAENEMKAREILLAREEEQKRENAEMAHEATMRAFDELGKEWGGFGSLSKFLSNPEQAAATMQELKSPAKSSTDRLANSRLSTPNMILSNKKRNSRDAEKKSGCR